MRLTLCSRVSLENVTGSQLVKKFPEFVEPEDSLRCSQEPASFLYPQMNPAHAMPFTFFKSYFNVNHPLKCRFSKRSLSFRFPIKLCTHFLPLPTVPHAAPPSNICRGTQNMKLFIMRFIWESAQSKWLLCQKRIILHNRLGCFGRLNSSQIPAYPPLLLPHTCQVQIKFICRI
jgi:hypothetical protein